MNQTDQLIQTNWTNLQQFTPPNWAQVHPPDRGLSVPVVLIVVAGIIILLIFYFRYLRKIALTAKSSTINPATMETNNPENTSAERDRVLRMLEDGKITAQESAELLNALSHPAPTPAFNPAITASPHRKWVVAGLGLLVIGFFLPWFSIDDVGAELNRNLSGVNRQMPQIPAFTSGWHVKILGGDVPHGLGWIVLLLGIAVATLPYLASNLDSQTQRKAKLIGLGIGGLILMYLLTDNIRFVSIGFIMGLVGYALQFIGTIKENRAVAG